MKRLSVFILLLCLFSVQAMALELAGNSEFDDLSGWPWSSWTGGIYYYDDGGGVNICSYGWWDEASIYQNTQQRILPNAPYVMQVMVRAAEGSAGDWGEGVNLQVQGIANAGAASEVWTLAGQSLNIFPTSDFQNGLTAPWHTYEYKFNFTAAPALANPFPDLKTQVLLVWVASTAIHS